MPMLKLPTALIALALALALAPYLSSASEVPADPYADVYGGRQDGYDTAYCPNGYRIQSCSFNTSTCDNTSQGYDSCSANSRNHQYCQFTGVCVSN